MAKNMFGGVRTQLVGALVATIGGMALTACSSSCCDPCKGGPSVYQRPCCARGAQPCGSCGYGGGMRPGYATPAPGYAAPAGGTMAPAPAPMAPAGPQKSCGAGKCG